MTQPVEYIPFESRRVQQALKEIAEAEAHVHLLAKMARDNEEVKKALELAITDLETKTQKFLAKSQGY